LHLSRFAGDLCEVTCVDFKSRFTAFTDREGVAVFRDDRVLLLLIPLLLLLTPSLDVKEVLRFFPVADFDLFFAIFQVKFINRSAV